MLFFLLILLLVLIILIPKGTGIPGSYFGNWSFPNLRTFGEIRINTRVSNYCQRGGSLLLLMISLLKGTGAFCSGNLQVHVCSIILVVLTALIS